MNVHSVPQTPSDSLSTAHSAQVPSQMLNSDYRELLIHHNFFFLGEFYCFNLSSIRIPDAPWRASRASH